MNRVYLLAILLFISFQLAGQNFVELGQVGYRYSFKTATDENQEGRSVQGWRLNALLPVKLSENTYLLPGFRFWQYDIEPGADLRLYFFQVGVQTKFSETWDWQLIPIVRSGVNQGTAFAQGIQVGLLTVVHQKIHSGLTLGYGLYTNNELFGQLLTPVLAVDWQINERWRLFGNFPMFTTLSYSINDRWNTGINYLGLVTSFKSGDEYVERQSLDFSAFLEYYITRNLVAQVMAGYPVGRHYDVYNEDDKVDFSLSILRFGDDRQLLETFDKSSSIVSFNLLFRVTK